MNENNKQGLSPLGAVALSPERIEEVVDQYFKFDTERGYTARFLDICQFVSAILSAAPTLPEAAAPDLLRWAVDRWHDEVALRPLKNIYRRTLDDVWREVIRFAGGDPISLIGPSHDDLLIAAKDAE